VAGLYFLSSFITSVDPILTDWYSIFIGFNTIYELIL
jgi:hypothetical protein